MIIARSPLRITLGGGGTDLPAYYRDHGGFLMAAAINKSVYVAVNRTFYSEILVRYSKIERVQRAGEVTHPIVREALRMVGLENERQLEITSMADIAAGTGLGSSGSFATALLKALHRFRNLIVTPGDLAEKACRIEIELLNEPVGKQDPYVAAHGGLNCYEFRPDGSVQIAPLACSEQTLRDFEERVLLFSTGITRLAPEMLKDQDDRLKQNDATMLENLHLTKAIGYESKKQLEAGNLVEYGRLLHEHWEHKKRRSRTMTSAAIDGWYEVARRNGAVGGKVIGAGGGGFLMFYSEDPTRLRRSLEAEGLQELRFAIDYEGTRVLQ